MAGILRHPGNMLESRKPAVATFIFVDYDDKIMHAVYLLEYAKCNKLFLSG